MSRVTPSRARIAWYRSAVAWKMPPAGPAVITIVRGGAGRTKRYVNQNAATTIRANGPTVAAKSRHETRGIGGSLR